MDVDESRARFEHVVPGLVEPLRRFLARRTDPATADDVLADTLLVCWRRIDQLPEAPDDALPWAYAVARRCLANAERGATRQRRVAAKLATLDPPTETAPGPGEDTADPELTAALARLRPDDVELLRLWAWERLTPGEIGTVLGITANAASLRLLRARQRLAEELRKTGASAGHEDFGEGRSS